MYTWDPEDYHRSSAAQQRMAMEVLSGMELRGGERMLDIGCGDGKITAHIAGLLPHGSVLGIDSSAAMVAFARESFTGADYPNLSFAVGDASRLDFSDEFDVVFSNSALHWILDHGPVLAGIARSLKPGGRTFLQMGGRGNAGGTWKSLVTLLGQERWARHFDNFTFPYGFFGAEEYREWVEAAGLLPHRVELVRRDMALPGREGMAAWIRTTWLPFTERIPESERGVFVDALTAEYLEEHPLGDDGLVHMDMVRLMVEAEKPA